MALPPRPLNSRGRRRSESAVATAEGKAAQRKRNREAGSVSSSGSSGKAKALANYPARTWEELIEGDEDLIRHVADIAGRISHSQMGNGGYLTSTINAPKEFAHALLEAHQQCSDGLVYIRIFHVPLDAYLGTTEEYDEEMIG